MSEYVLDASALLAMIHGEPGAERVASVLQHAAISAVNLAEVVGVLAERGFEPVEIRRDLSRLPLRILPVDEDLGYAAGFLRPATKAFGLSLGDRTCLALAARLAATALTADRAWSRLGAEIRIELLQRS